MLRNAIIYAGEAGPIVVEVGEEHGEVRISVRDKGPGAPEQDLPLLLEPFYRGKASLTHPGGSGLGLSIVKQIVRLHAGTVTVASEYGKGTTFTVQIPVK